MICEIQIDVFLPQITPFMASCKLKKIPKDVSKIILDEQAKIKEEKGTFSFSIESTVYKIIREYKRCKDENKNFK